MWTDEQKWNYLEDQYREQAYIYTMDEISKPKYTK